MATIGIDYANIDGGSAPDFAAAKKAGVRFVIPRAMYGRRVKGQTSSSPVFIDPVWARDRDAIRAAGLKRSAYMFICFEQPGVQTPPPEVQAQCFIDYVKLDPAVDLVPMIDVEEASTSLPAARMYDWVLRIATKLKEHYGAWPGLYTSARVWAENLDHHSPGELLNCPPWIAKPWPWPVRTPAHLDGAPAYQPVLIPEFGSSWFLYQYQGDATGFPGFTRTVDINRPRVFGEGAKGAHVVWMQKRLGVAADGIFGSKTTAALKAFQGEQKLAADGIFGLDTFQRLCWKLPA